MVEKVSNVEAKTNLQSPFYVSKIDSRCLKGHCPLAKRDKENTYQETHDEAFKDKDKAKLHNSSISTN